MANIPFLLNIPGTHCPIGGGIMNDPAVLAGTGLSYERAAIVAHLRAHGTDPATGLPLSVREQRLLPNPALKGLIDAIMVTVAASVQPEA
jgi:hypothetical protein